MENSQPHLITTTLLPNTQDTSKVMFISLTQVNLLTLGFQEYYHL